MIFKSFISYLLGFMSGSILLISVVLGEIWAGVIASILFFILSQLISVNIKNKMKKNYWKKLESNLEH
jgi:hypothetical protein